MNCFYNSRGNDVGLMLHGASHPQAIGAIVCPGINRGADVLECSKISRGEIPNAAK